VYPGVKGNYNEKSPLLPKNNYSWSKLGGESAVQMYKNSLILRVCMTEKPFVHKKAFCDFITNFIFHDQVAKIIFKLINKKGVINIGGKSQSVYNFARKYNSKIKKNYAKKMLSSKYPLNPSMNIKKLRDILKS
jgi:dTDP-4-dehydrorhamnose reductase